MFDEQEVTGACPEIDPWKTVGIEKEPIDDFFFEDSFTTNDHANITRIKEDYTPLDDSSHYLASLEKKLSKLKGLQTKQDKLNEHRQLLNSLTALRKDCFRRFLDSSHVAEEQNFTEEPPSVNPDSNLGNLMKKVYPEKVALSAEELCELLKADLLAKNHEELSKDDPQPLTPE